MNFFFKEESFWQQTFRPFVSQSQRWHMEGKLNKRNSTEGITTQSWHIISEDLVHARGSLDSSRAPPNITTTASAPCSRACWQSRIFQLTRALPSTFRLSKGSSIPSSPTPLPSETKVWLMSGRGCKDEVFGLWSQGAWA